MESFGLDIAVTLVGFSYQYTNVLFLMLNCVCCLPWLYDLQRNLISASILRILATTLCTDSYDFPFSLTKYIPFYRACRVP